MIRSLAHLIGWHTNACRGDVDCTPRWDARVLRCGWYRE